MTAFQHNSSLEDDAESVLLQRDTPHDSQRSIFSLSTSSTVTLFNVAGPGHIIDKYFYQPGERLVEKVLDRLTAHRQIHRATRAINQAFESALSNSPEDIISYKYDTLKIRKKTGMKGLFHVWGVQDLPGWNEETVSRECMALARLSRHFSRSAQIKAITSIINLIHDYPRLRLYFNIFDLRRRFSKAPSGNLIRIRRHSSYPFFQEEMRNLTQTTDILRRLSLNWTLDLRISRQNLHLLRPGLLSLLDDALFCHASRRLSPRLADVVVDMLCIEGLYCFDFDVPRDDFRNEPLVQFWAECSAILIASGRISSMLLYRLGHLLYRGLQETWHGPEILQLPSRPMEQVEYIIRISFKTALGLMNLTEGGYRIPLYTHISGLSSFRDLVQEKSGLPKARIDKEWRDCIWELEINRAWSLQWPTRGSVPGPETNSTREIDHEGFSSPSSSPVFIANDDRSGAWNASDITISRF